ncbi:tripartite tricarboxylate transporter TctB family protein [Jannaschia sp. Os4]|uniref:tripartite tricarboxylate transporter TctB family protein n=1 Tax=Jannaschia sp. Os4 TaxID=2807617 RepID=UPI00193961DD|nr:tripartite tricarboxylate transporter TctB family protein [Jannaschia sp. Os4]MBM2576994.1 tripartite tricarboxylate transporter TctB family protein [Jannaschia sp. Os4]
MFASDRIFGAVVVLGSLAYVASASQIAAPFFSDPLGSRAFPMAVGLVAALCGLAMMWKPDDEPDWPPLKSLGALAVATAALVAYAYLLRPLGFLLPTAAAAALLSYQIAPRPVAALLTGIGLSAGLWALFRFVLGLSLRGLPEGMGL